MGSRIIAKTSIVAGICEQLIESAALSSQYLNVEKLAHLAVGDKQAAR